MKMAEDAIPDWLRRRRWKNWWWYNGSQADDWIAWSSSSHEIIVGMMVAGEPFHPGWGPLQWEHRRREEAAREERKRVEAAERRERERLGPPSAYTGGISLKNKGT